MAKTSQLVSIHDFNQVSEHEEGTEIELLRANGISTGVFLKIQGNKAPQVRRITNQIAQKAIATRQKSNQKAPPIEEYESLVLDRALAGVVGWRGLKEEFSRDLLRDFLLKNPLFVDQIIEAIDNETLFTKG